LSGEKKSHGFSKRPNLSMLKMMMEESGSGGRAVEEGLKVPVEEKVED